MSLPSLTFGSAQSAASSAVGSLQDSTAFFPTLILGSPNASITQDLGGVDQGSSLLGSARSSASATPPSLFGGSGGFGVGDTFALPGVGTSEGFGMGWVVVIGVLVVWYMRKK